MRRFAASWVCFQTGSRKRFLQTHVCYRMNPDFEKETVEEFKMSEKKYCSTSCWYFVFKADSAFCKKYGYCEIDREVINYSEAMLCLDCLESDSSTGKMQDGEPNKE